MYPRFLGAGEKAVWKSFLPASVMRQLNDAWQSIVNAQMSQKVRRDWLAAQEATIMGKILEVNVRKPEGFRWGMNREMFWRLESRARGPIPQWNYDVDAEQLVDELKDKLIASGYKVESLSSEQPSFTIRW